MTELIAEFADGTKKTVSLTYEQFMKMFREASLDGKPLKAIEVLSKQSNKGPNRIRFA